ncbi:MAG: UDP-2,3-diacylglucosamine diphosphatase [Leptospiraceae bacterium]|nr:UDP-2,3-diacylglucosamine diphosphatase [Leptospiraceae bacterium]
MKFRKNRVYDAFFISDVHYLVDKKIKNHHHKELFQLLDFFIKRNIRFRKVILAGDIIENWFFSAARKYRQKQKRFDKLFDRLDCISAKRGSKYYIIGNHDTTSFSMQLPPDIKQYLQKRYYLITGHYEDRNLIVVHGHQGQYTQITWVLHIAIVRLFHSLAFLIPRLFYFAEDFYDRHLNRVDPVTPEQKLAYYRRLSQHVHQKNKVLIAGHTHDFLCLPELKMMNTGDWVKNRSFIIRKSGTYYGMRLLKRKAIQLEFSWTDPDWRDS